MKSVWTWRSSFDYLSFLFVLLNDSGFQRNIVRSQKSKVRRKGGMEERQEKGEKETGEGERSEGEHLL